MKILYLFSFLFFIICCTAPRSVENQKYESEKETYKATDEITQLLYRVWPIGQTRVTYNNNITRLNGVNTDNRMTNITYKTFQTQCDEINAQAKNQMWTPEKLSNMLSGINIIGKGGSIAIRIDRSTIGWADTKNFTVIITDSLEKEVYRKQLESNVADLPSHGRGWCNNGYAYIPNPIKKPFYIYIVDALAFDGTGVGDSKYKFKVW